jgi:hypothetical protein
VNPRQPFVLSRKVSRATAEKPSRRVTDSLKNSAFAVITKYLTDQSPPFEVDSCGCAGWDAQCHVSAPSLAGNFF